MAEIKLDKTFSIQPQKPADHNAKMRDAAQMYEEYFLNEMVKSMRKTVQHSELSKPTMAEKIYSEQLDSNVVENWSKRGGVGLADLIYNQLQDRFYNSRGPAMRPLGPMPLEKGINIKIDETREYGIPVAAPQNGPGDVSFLYEWDNPATIKTRDVTTPYAGQVIQMYQVGEERQVVKLAHPDGLTSTLSFLGRTQDLKMGDNLGAGQKLGTLSFAATGLTWQVGRVERS